MAQTVAHFLTHPPTVPFRCRVAWLGPLLASSERRLAAREACRRRRLLTAL
jgi:hypothetical protein